MTFLTLAAETSNNAPSMMGRIIGGWNYVWVAYGLSWAGLVLYGFSLFLRRSKKD